MGTSRRGPHVRHDVDLEGQGPVRLRGVEPRSGLDAGVREEHVHGLEPLQGHGDERRDPVLARAVTDEGGGRASQLFNDRAHRLVEVGDKDAEALPDQPLGDRPPDPPGGASHDGRRPRGIHLRCHPSR
jgi:hypothetical protein